jgi:Flp pilus assembly protein TadG
MLSPLIRRARKNGNEDAHSKQRGVTIALVAISMVVIIGMAALSIDVGTLYQAKAEAQRAADAAALAAARVISISGITGDPTNASASWQPICGTAGTATLAATAVAQSPGNVIGRVPASKVTVSYGAGGAATDCSTLVGSSFSVNPIVTVYVQQANLPTFFARVFSLLTNGTSTNSGVSATATAEVFNPSNSGAFASGGEMVPVQPRCVKPIIVPNLDPWHPSSACVGAACSPFVGKVAGAEGSILNGGVSLNGGGGGVIGETFNLIADCTVGGGTCSPPLNAQPMANGAGTLPSLQYLPGLAPATSAAAPSCSNATPYQQAVAGCDQTTAYQCGVQSAIATPPNVVDLTENPSGPTGDAATAAQCLTLYGNPAATGQDQLLTVSYPFQIQAGSANPLNVSGSNISSSDSIVTIPIYDSTTPLGAGTQPTVTIVGFLQVFINQVNADGSLSVTVMNVAGCGNTVPSGTQALTGTSPVPVRLITPTP